MKTHNERAREAVKLVLGTVALLRPRTVEEMKMVEELAATIIETMFEEAQTELLQSQRDTAVALANALNVAQGK